MTRRAFTSALAILGLSAVTGMALAPRSAAARTRPVLPAMTGDYQGSYSDSEGTGSLEVKVTGQTDKAFEGTLQPDYNAVPPEEPGQVLRLKGKIDGKGRITASAQGRRHPTVQLTNIVVTTDSGGLRTITADYKIARLRGHMTVTEVPATP